MQKNFFFFLLLTFIDPLPLFLFPFALTAVIPFFASIPLGVCSMGTIWYAVVV